MFNAKIFNPSRLCAIYRLEGLSEAALEAMRERMRQTRYEAFMEDALSRRFHEGWIILSLGVQDTRMPPARAPKAMGVLSRGRRRVSSGDGAVAEVNSGIIRAEVGWLTPCPRREPIFRFASTSLTTSCQSLHSALG